VPRSTPAREGGDIRPRELKPAVRSSQHRRFLCFDTSNHGAAAFTGATATFDGTWANSGTLSSAGGTLNTAGNWSNGGTIATNGGAWNISGTWSNTSSVSGVGTIVTLGGSSTGTGSVSFTDSTVDITGTYTTAQLTGISLSNTALSLVSGGNVLNAGDTLMFTPSFPLQLKGGRITGGALSAATGSEPVIPTASFVTLDGVSLETTLSLQQGSTVAFAGSWDNKGVVQADNATIGLGGTFTPDKIGTLQRTGGTIRLTGAINNTGSTFNADAVGSWQLAGGTITGGTVGAAPGASFSTARPTSSTLNGVTLTAPSLVVSSGSTLNVQNGLTLDTAPGGDPSGPKISLSAGTFGTASVTFTGTQTLAGTGSLIFDGDGPSNGVIRPSGAGSTLTLGRGVTVQTGTRGGTVGAAGLATINQGLISARTPSRTITLAGTFTNHGTIEARNGAAVVLAGPNPPGTSLKNYANGTLTGGAWDVYAGSVLNIGSSAAVTTNAADVALSGSGSQFAAIAPLNANQGTFAILAGRDFTTAGALTSSGRLVAGAGSDLTVSGNLSIVGDAATLAVEFFEDDGGAGAEGYGQYAVAGTASLDGTLEVLLAPGYSFSEGDTFTVVTASAINGTFDSLVHPQEIAVEILYGPTNVQLLVTAVPEPAALTLLALGTGFALRRRRRRA
jgi:hypothetical protein